MVDRLPPLRVAVVGVGHFGFYHCDKINSLPGASLAAVVDSDLQHAETVARRLQTSALVSLEKLKNIVDAAVVAVPSQLHHQVASKLLSMGIDVLVEKPLATTSDDALDLCQIAEGTGAMIQVGHLERFNPILDMAFDKIEKPRFIGMQRTGPFPGRGAEVDVVYELMIHDLDILARLTTAPVVKVWAMGWKVVTNTHDTVWARLEFADGLVAQLNASRVSAEQKRGFLVLDSNGVVEVDLAGRSMKTSSFVDGKQSTETIGPMDADPLLEQDRSFIRAAVNGRKPIVSGRTALAAVKLAESIVSVMEDLSE